MRNLLMRPRWWVLVAVGLAFIASLSQPWATVARRPCKPHKAVRFAITEFSEKLGPCTRLRDSIQSEIESILQERGIRVAAKNEHFVPLLSVSVTGAIRDDGRGYYSIYYRMFEDLDHVVDDEHFTILAITMSNRPTIEYIDTGKCGDIERHLRNMAYSFAMTQHDVM